MGPAYLTGAQGMPKLDGRKLMLWPLAAPGASLLLLLAFVTNGLVSQFDDNATQREQEVIANGMTGRVLEIGHMVVPQTVWDDAVKNLDNRFDRGWA